MSMNKYMVCTVMENLENVPPPNSIHGKVIECEIKEYHGKIIEF